MRTEDKDKKFRRWPPRVRRRRPAAEPEATPPRESGHEPAAPKAGSTATRHQDSAGRDVKVKFRTRRRVVRPPSESQD